MVTLTSLVGARSSCTRPTQRDQAAPVAEQDEQEEGREDGHVLARLGPPSEVAKLARPS